MSIDIYENLLEPVKTPLLKIEPGLYAKAEFCQKTGSVKDRFVFLAVKRAVTCGEINEKSVLVEATSGNTGISLSAAGAMLGVPVEIIMPENMSEERKQMMRRFGAKVIEVGPSDFSSAIEMRNKLVDENENYWSPMQFENNLNVEIHRHYTAPEIDSDMKALKIEQWDFISGAGTGGTLMGVSEFVTSQSIMSPLIHKVVQVAPKEDAKSHGIQGINDGEDFLLDRNKLPDQILVSTSDAIQAAQDFAKTHGFLVGISSGANLVAARAYLQKNLHRNVVTLLCDRGERYFSTS